jgi:hypothetical protein
MKEGIFGLNCPAQLFLYRIEARQWILFLTLSGNCLLIGDSIVAAPGCGTCNGSLGTFTRQTWFAFACGRQPETIQASLARLEDWPATPTEPQLRILEFCWRQP